jgi:hypothetical protein
MKLFPSGKHVRQKDIAQCFGIPASTLKVMLQNATKLNCVLKTAAIVLMQSDIGRPDSTST